MGRTNDRLVCRFTSPHHPCGDSRYSPSPHGHPVPERSARPIAPRAVFHKLPATYVQRDYVQAGSLMSYGSNIVDADRQLGAMPAASFRDAKPTDLPVEQSTKFELVINLKTAKALGLDTATPSATRRRGDRLDKALCCDCSQPLVARTRPTGTSALTSAFEGKNGPDMLGSSSSHFDPIQT